MALEKRFSYIFGNKEVPGEHTVEITKEMARGAMHVVKNKPLPVEKLVKPVTSSVVEATSKAGIKPLDSLMGASKGVIRGASETGMDLGEATKQTMEAAREIAANTGISEKAAVIQAAEGALRAAEVIGPEAAAEVAEVHVSALLSLQEEGGY